MFKCKFTASFCIVPNKFLESYLRKMKNEDPGTCTIKNSLHRPCHIFLTEMKNINNAPPISPTLTHSWTRKAPIEFKYSLKATTSTTHCCTHWTETSVCNPRWIICWSVLTHVWNALHKHAPSLPHKISCELNAKGMSTEKDFSLKWSRRLLWKIQLLKLLEQNIYPIRKLLLPILSDTKWKKIHCVTDDKLLNPMISLGLTAFVFFLHFYTIEGIDDGYCHLEKAVYDCLQPFRRFSLLESYSICRLTSNLGSLRKRLGMKWQKNKINLKSWSDQLDTTSK